MQPQFARDYVGSIGLGLDLTARDLQLELKKKGLPWEKAKGFDNSAPLSPEFIPLDEWHSGKGGAPATPPTLGRTSPPELDDITFGLYKNGERVQHGNTRNMLFPIEEIICYVSQYFRLQIGDLIFTGTPEGVGPIAIGDELVGFIEIDGEEREMLRCRVK